MEHLTLYSYGYTGPKPYVGDTLDVSELPDPAYRDGLADLTGLDEPVIAFLEEQYVTSNLFQRALAVAGNAEEMAVRCPDGLRRSVYLAEGLAAILRAQGREVTLKHLGLEAKAEADKRRAKAAANALELRTAIKDAAAALAGHVVEVHLCSLNGHKKRPRNVSFDAIVAATVELPGPLALLGGGDPDLRAHAETDPDVQRAVLKTVQKVGEGHPAVGVYGANGYGLSVYVASEAARFLSDAGIGVTLSHSHLDTAGPPGTGTDIRAHITGPVTIHVAGASEWINPKLAFVKASFGSMDSLAFDMPISHPAFGAAIEASSVGTLEALTQEVLRLFAEGHTHVLLRGDGAGKKAAYTAYRILNTLRGQGVQAEVVNYTKNEAPGWVIPAPGFGSPLQEAVSATLGELTLHVWDKSTHYAHCPVIYATPPTYTPGFDDNVPLDSDAWAHEMARHAGYADKVIARIDDLLDHGTTELAVYGFKKALWATYQAAVALTARGYAVTVVDHHNQAVPGWVALHGVKALTQTKGKLSLKESTALSTLMLASIPAEPTPSPAGLAAGALTLHVYKEPPKGGVPLGMSPPINAPSPLIGHGVFEEGVGSAAFGAAMDAQTNFLNTVGKLVVEYQRGGYTHIPVWGGPKHAYAAYRAAELLSEVGVPVTVVDHDHQGIPEMLSALVEVKVPAETTFAPSPVTPPEALTVHVYNVKPGGVFTGFAEPISVLSPMIGDDAYDEGIGSAAFTGEMEAQPDFLESIAHSVGELHGGGHTVVAVRGGAKHLYAVYRAAEALVEAGTHVTVVDHNHHGAPPFLDARVEVVQP